MRTVASILLALALASIPIRAENGNGSNWAQWRGHSSPIVWGDRIFLTTSLKGALVPGRKAPVLRTNSVGEPVFASPAIANGRLYIRGEHHLFAIGNAR